MPKRSPNDDLSAAIAVLRESALQTRAATHDAVLIAQIDLALRDLEEIPKLFDAADQMLHALTLPQARIRFVREAMARQGRQSSPGD